jgi:hypothetical protein
VSLQILGYRWIEGVQAVDITLRCHEAGDVGEGLNDFGCHKVYQGSHGMAHPPAC